MRFTRTTALGSKQRLAAGLLPIVMLLDTTSWALFIALIHLVRKEDAHNATLHPYYSDSELPFILKTTLPPLILATLTVPTLLTLALQHRLHPILALCVAVPSFCLWSALGIINAIASDPYFTENMNPDVVDEVRRAVAGVQCAEGAVWLVGVVLAGRWVHKHNGEKWAERWVGEEVRRRMAGGAV